MSERDKQTKRFYWVCTAKIYMKESRALYLGRETCLSEKKESDTLKNTLRQMHLRRHAYQVKLICMYEVTLHILVEESNERYLVTLLLIMAGFSLNPYFLFCIRGTFVVTRFLSHASILTQGNV